MQCVTCKETKAEQEFHADNKTGWSKLCKACRDKRNNRAYMRRYRQRKKLSEAVAKADEAQNSLKLAFKLMLLQKEFKRFTLLNRTAIQQLKKKLNCESPDPRTVEAYERRTKRQREAEEIYNGQMQMVRIGITPKPINEIWRMNHGEYARSEGKKENQADIGCTPNLSLLAVYGGDGEVGSS